MKVSNKKKHEYRNHFAQEWAVMKMPTAPDVTGPRLRKIKEEIWQDDFFWSDIVWRHNGDKQTPEQMRESNVETYHHCLGNFWGMIIQTLVERGLVKTTVRR